jgi:hypothetical protein
LGERRAIPAVKGNIKESGAVEPAGAAAANNKCVPVALIKFREAG